jgi:flagellar hook-associated protein 2
MSGISSGIGLVSGINYASLISQLIAIDSQPEQVVNSQIAETQAEQQGYADLEVNLNSIQSIGNDLALPQTFQAADTNSSNPNVLTATAAEGAAVGTYQFQVAQLVSTQQSITNGFANATTSPVGAGTLTIEQGGGQASSQTALSQLNGGAGVQRGQFRITDRSGASAVIDTSDAVTLHDVVSDINSAANISVKATLTNNGIQLTDTSGKSADALTVSDLNGGSAASSLGIAGSADPNGTTPNTIAGTSINYIGTGTQLTSLNDGRGVQTNGANPDFQINLSDGSTVAVTLGSAQTVGDVIKAINTAGNGKVTASIGTDGRSLQLQDNTGGTTTTLGVVPLNGSTAAAQLGLTNAAAGSTITGSDVLSSLDSVLVSSLNGGNGIPLGQISITDKAGNNNGPIDLSGASSVSDIINLINNNTEGVKVKASLNSSGTGIQLTDISGGSGSLVIADVNSTTAAALGIAGTSTTGTVTGSNLQTQYISNNTLLSTLGGGQGVNLGQFSITNSAGATNTVNLATGTISTVGDVIKAINAAHAGVTASINATGNGLLITDNSSGAGKLTIKDTAGTSAADLNIAGTAATNTINGAFQKTITVTSTDTLTTVQNKINSLGFAVTAQIVNDGSATNPYRLSLTSTNSGQAGAVIIDGGTTNLNPTTLVQGQDAAVFYGGGGASQALLVTSSNNQISNLIKGVTLNLTGASSNPVTLTVTNDPSNVESDLTNFVTQFNALTTQIGTFTTFNTTTNQGGLLLGDQTTQQIQSVLFGVVNSVVKGAGQYQSLADLGITIGNNAQLSFNTNTFSAAFASNPQAVQNLFSQGTLGLGSQIATAVTNLTDPVTGLITLASNTLSTRITNYQSYETELATLVAQKQTQLQTEFANLEVGLAQLQSQQQALGSLNSTLASDAAANSAASASSSNSSSSTSNNLASGTSSSSSGG